MSGLNWDMQLTADVSAAQEGDHAAFGRLVDRCGNTVTSIILAIVRDLEACEDLAQDVFLSAWANLKKLRNPDSFLPWIRQTARNRANTWLRERIRDRRRHCRDEDLLAQAVDPSPDAAGRVLAREERVVLYDVIEQLPDEAREVVTLFYREGRSTKQVALLLDLREETVRQRLSRARAKVREQMLARFGRAVAKSASGAALTAAVMTAMTATAPFASAGTAAAAAGKLAGHGFLGKLGAAVMGALPGAIGGLLGVYYGFRKELMREREPEARKALVRLFLYATLGVVGTVVAFGVTGSTGNPWPALVAYTAFTVVLLLVYGVALPNIIAPSRARALEADPSLRFEQTRERRRKRWMMILGLTVGWGTMILAMWLKFTV